MCVVSSRLSPFNFISCGICKNESFHCQVPRSLTDFNPLVVDVLPAKALNTTDKRHDFDLIISHVKIFLFYIFIAVWSKQIVRALCALPLPPQKT